MNKLYTTQISDEEIKSAKVPNDTLLIVTEKSGSTREISFGTLMSEKGDEFNSTDYMYLCAALVYFGSYTAGSYFGWRAKVKAGALQPK